MADQLATRFLEGKAIGIHKNPRLGPATEHDRETFARITGQTADDFNRHLSNKLRYVSDLAAARAAEALEQNLFKPGELGFILSVAEDKRARLDGNSMIHSATVNIQVNNINGAGAGSGPTKDQLLELLHGQNRLGIGNGAESVRVSFPATPAKLAEPAGAVVDAEPASQKPQPAAQLPAQEPSIPASSPAKAAFPGNAGP